MPKSSACCVQCWEEADGAVTFLPRGADVCLSGISGGCAVFADAFVVELRLVYLVAVYAEGAHCGGRFVHEVEYLAASATEEMDVRVGIAVVAHAMVVDGNHLGCMVLRQHAQRVVNGGAA